jgi:aspartate racemase
MAAVAQKIVGLIGGMSWESSAEYYRLINQGVRARLGGAHSARCLMWSFDFGEIEALQHRGDWQALGDLMADAARRLTEAGAELLLICTNTMHKLALRVEQATDAPLLHIADCTARPILAAGIRRVGLLGTAFTMEQDFYRGRLAERFGLDVLTPDEADRRDVHRIIYDELVQGRIEPASRKVYRDVMARLAARGAEAIILGCTEVSLLVSAADADVPLFDTTALHAEAAVEAALA